MTRKSFRLYAHPSFWEGIARLVDARGILDEYNYAKSEGEADLRALESDWEAVGEDICQALVEFKRKYHGLVSGKASAKAGC